MLNKAVHVVKKPLEHEIGSEDRYGRVGEVAESSGRTEEKREKKVGVVIESVAS